MWHTRHLKMTSSAWTVRRNNLGISKQFTQVIRGQSLQQISEFGLLDPSRHMMQNYAMWIVFWWAILWKDGILTLLCSEPSWSISMLSVVAVTESWSGTVSTILEAKPPVDFLAVIFNGGMLDGEGWLKSWWLWTSDAGSNFFSGHEVRQTINNMEHWTPRHISLWTRFTSLLRPNRRNHREQTTPQTSLFYFPPAHCDFDARHCCGAFTRYTCIFIFLTSPLSFWPATTLDLSLFAMNSCALYICTRILNFISTDQ